MAQCHIHGMNDIKTICVYCGSGAGTNPAFEKAATLLGKTLAENRIRLVYGGGSIGLMGAVARSAIAHGGEVTGIIPEFLLEREHALKDGQELVVTRDMHERKQMMFDRSDAFVAMPGGLGTLEEVIEQMTWAQLGQHRKPILLGNIDGFWQPLLTLIDHMRELAFIRAGLTVEVLTASRIEDILPTLSRALADKPEPERLMAAPAADKL